MNRLRFSVFADLHYRDGDWNWASRRLESVLARAQAERVDFIMHCGDFCHNVVTARAIIERYNHFPIPAYHTLGNHDFENIGDLRTVLAAYRMGEKGYHYFDRDGFRVISLDTNFRRAADGSFVHYAAGDEYAKCHQDELWIPDEELAFLRDALATAPGPCVVFSHGSAVRPDGVVNREAVRGILGASSGRRGRVLLWINGHHHRNQLQLVDNIAFFDLNSTTSDWIVKPHRAYPPELMAKFALSHHELLYSEAVHAVVTVAEDGEIEIEGMKGGMFMDVTREMTGNERYDKAGLPCDPSVLSAHFTLVDR